MVSCRFSLKPIHWKIWDMNRNEWSEYIYIYISELFRISWANQCGETIWQIAMFCRFSERALSAKIWNDKNHHIYHILVCIYIYICVCVCVLRMVMYHMVYIIYIYIHHICSSLFLRMVVPEISWSHLRRQASRSQWFGSKVPSGETQTEQSS